VAEKCSFFWLKWLKNVCFSGGSGRKMCVFRAEVAEKHAFSRQKWPKKRGIFWVEVAEKHMFFMQKWLKNVFFWAEVAEKCAFFGLKWLKNVHFLGRSG
jgi:hypothetical protein